MNGKRYALYGFLSVLLLASVVVLSLFILNKREVSRQTEQQPEASGQTVEELLNQEETEPEVVYYQGETYEERTDLETILLLGIDQMSGSHETEGYQTGGQADFQVLIVLDHEKKTYTAIHINRDTMTSVRVLGILGDEVGREQEQIALAYAYGDGGEVSCENAADAVSNLLYGVKIDHYAAIQMDGIPQLNDLIGGVTVSVEDDFSQVDPTIVQGQNVTLRGSQALTYVRSRYYVDDDTNLSRMGRQQQYMTGFLDQLEVAAETDPEIYLKLYDEASDFLVTNLSGADVSQLMKQVSGYQNLGIQTLDGTVQQGEVFMEYYPDEDALFQLVLKLFYRPQSQQTEDAINEEEMPNG